MASSSLSFIIGIIGNVISILLFASPMGTFWEILTKKSTGNYKSLPYISTLLSTSLWTFYGINKPDLLVSTVNGAGAVLQLIYVTLYLIFAPKDKKIKSMIAVAILDIGFLGAIIAISLLAIHGSLRVTFVGIVCAVLTIGMYASPLSAMATVIKTKSVEYMPFLLSLFLFLNAGIWSIYSVLVKDYFIGVPNGIGFVLGSAQLIIYTIYKDKPKSQKSMDKATSTKTEVGSAHLVSRPTIEMKDPNKLGQQDEEAAIATTADAKMNKMTLSKGNSLPNPRPSLTRQLSSFPVLMRTLSLGPYDVHYSFSRDKDVDVSGHDF